MCLATIVSQSTPSGFSATATIRLSGPKATDIAKKLSKNNKPFKHRTAEVRNIYCEQDLIDEAVFTAFFSPKSYTGENVVEISCHGNIHICEATIKETIRLGARVAEPGEYTKRAFLNGKINLIQAESVAQLINAKSIEAAKQQTKNLSGGVTKKIKRLKRSLILSLAHLEYELDVSEEVFLDANTLIKLKKNLKDALNFANSITDTFDKGAALAYGVKIAFVGKPNVGKSTLVNKILGVDKSITSDTPGTTRDIVSTETTMNGTPVLLLDTAGIHNPKDNIEAEGIRRALDEIQSADLVVSLFCKGTKPVDIKGLKKQVYVYNKIDLSPYTGGKKEVFMVSATTGQGLNSLINHIKEKIGFIKVDAAEPLITTIRQKNAMLGISSYLTSALRLLNENGKEIELPAQEIRSAIDNIDLFTGKTTTNDILDQVFSSFCVGK